MRIDVETRPWFEIADRADLSYEEKLGEYRRLADEYFQADEYAEFCAGPLAHLEEAAREWFRSDEFDRLITATVRSTFPPQEHERFVEHYRGLVTAWSAAQA
jgi:hypothetical protein